MDTPGLASDHANDGGGASIDAISADFFAAYEAADVVTLYRNVTADSAELICCRRRDGTVVTPARGTTLFHVEELFRRPGRSRFLIGPDDEFAAFVDPIFAASAGIRSTAFFLQQGGDESLVVVFGFSVVEDFSCTGSDAVSIGAFLQEWASKFIMVIRLGKWPLHCLATISALACELREIVRLERDLNRLVYRVGELIYESLILRESTSTVSIWLADHPRQLLKCVHNFAPEGAELARSELRFGEGLIGWVAQHRQTLNVDVSDAGRLSPNGTPLGNQYVSLWVDNAPTRAEVVVPMIFRGRVIGVLNLEFSESTRFSPEFEALATWLCTHASMTIHQLQVNELYHAITSSDDIEELAEQVVYRAGNLVEAACCAFFSSDLERQALKLRHVVTRPGQPDQSGWWTPGAWYYRVPGVGLTRWPLEHGMPLVVSNVVAMANPTHPLHKRQLEEFCEQVLQHTTDPGSEEKPFLVPCDQPEWHRKCWHLHVPGEEEPRLIWQPVWSSLHVEESTQDQSVMLVPILDPGACDSDSSRAMGVIRFSRWPGQEPFSLDDVRLVQNIARHSAQVLARIRQDTSHRQELKTIAEIAKIEPEQFGQGLQEPLQQELARIRDAVGADVVLVRGVEGNQDDSELILVACEPFDRDEQGQAKMLVPRVVHLGWGPTGQAVEDAGPVYVQSSEDSLIKHLKERAFGEREHHFINRLQSAAAVPLIVDGSVVGALAAVSYQKAEHHVYWDGEQNKWRWTTAGIQDIAIDVLQYHARWLAPSLAILLELEERQRHQITIAKAVDRLSEILAGDGSPYEFYLPGLVMATHHDGFRFHQAFLASCEHGEDGQPSTMTPMKKDVGIDKWMSAWGSVTFTQRDEAINRQDSLAHDIDYALQNPEVCQDIHESWVARNPVQLAVVPKEPCVFARTNGVDAEGDETLVRWMTSSGEGEWVDQLLNEFCDILNVDPKTRPGCDIQVGMVPLDEEDRPRAVMFVTRVAFDDEQSPRMRSLSPKSLHALCSLGQVFGLSQQTHERRTLEARIAGLKDLPDIISAGLTTNIAVVTRLEIAIRDAHSNQDDLEDFMGGISRLLDAQRRCYDAIAGNILGQEATPGAWREVDIIEVVEPLLRDFQAFFKWAMRLRFDWDIPESCRYVHCQLDKEQLETALTVCLWTARELIQGKASAEFHGLVFAAASTNDEFEFTIKHWGRVLEFDGDSEEILGRPWETGLLLKAVDRIIGPSGGSLRSRLEEDAQVISLILPLRVTSHEN